MSKAPPKRHHYIPQMMLRHFADIDGNLWFWRRDFEIGDVRKTTPENLFVEKDLYTQVYSDGTKDVRLEEHFSRMEDVSSDFIRQLADIIREGNVPILNDGAWECWYRFFYFQIKRAPRYMRAFAEQTGLDERVRSAVDELKQREAASGITDGHEELEERVYKNAIVIAQGQQPIEEVLDAFRNVGLIIYRIANPKKSLIVGDVPGATAQIGYQEDVSSARPPFIPLTHDIAVGLLDKPKRVKLVTVDEAQVRRMNTATAARSFTLAGRSRELIASLSRTVPYEGLGNLIGTESFG